MASSGGLPFVEHAERSVVPSLDAVADHPL